MAASMDWPSTCNCFSYTVFMPMQTWNATDYAAHGRFVSDLGGAILGWLQPVSGEEILDIGCGDGALTEKIAQSGAKVQGIDISTSMVEGAQKRGLQAVVMDATQMPFERKFDAVFSNAALHWIHDQPALLRNVAQSLKPNGRFVAEMGGHGNIAAIRVALHAALSRHQLGHLAADGNFYAAPQEYRRLLEEYGFIVEAMELVPRPTPLASGMAAWVQTFRRGILDQVPTELREIVVQDTVNYLQPVLCDRDGNWTADYVRLRFRAQVADFNSA